VKVVAIVQARMNSSRFPGKVLADIHGRTMLQCLLDRVKSVKEIDEIVVATSESVEDDVLEQWLDNNNIKCFRGSEHDVLDRFYFCAKEYSADIIVRITADDPLKDPDIIRRAIAIMHNDSVIDYCSNTLAPSYPEGLDIEVFKCSALDDAFHESTLNSDREHVTPYIWRNTEKYNTHNFVFNRDLSSWRWTVDKVVDLEFICKIYHYYKDDPLVPFTKIIEYIDRNPELREINEGIVRNEGYLKSLSIEK
jgi:spore coat polysaccharide biosynthesis protein SpsF